MSKFGITLDENYRRLSAHATDMRRTIRQTVHQPEKRATTRTLFLIGLATLLVAGGSLFLMG